MYYYGIKIKERPTLFVENTVIVTNLVEVPQTQQDTLVHIKAHKIRTTNPSKLKALSQNKHYQQTAVAN